MTEDLREILAEVKKAIRLLARSHNALGAALDLVPEPRRHGRKYDRACEAWRATEDYFHEAMS